MTDGVDNRSKAVGWLNLARSRANKQRVDLEISNLREYANKAGCTLEDLGTNEEELGALIIQSHRSEAVSWLRLARMLASDGEIKAEIAYLRGYASKAGCTLEDLGTNEEELDALIIQGNRSEAIMWLGLARERANRKDIKTEVSWLRQFVSLAGCTLEDLGTNEEELAALQSK